MKSYLKDIDGSGIFLAQYLQSSGIMTKFDAVILAGFDREKVDPLTAESGIHHKALLPVQGRPMITHVTDALRSSDRIKRIAVVGLGPEDGIDLGSDIYYLPDQGGLFDNVVCGYEWAAQLDEPTEHVLLASGDMPLLKGEHIAWFADACLPLEKDVYWGIVSQEVMESVFPNSKRSYLALQEGKFCSGDLFFGRTASVIHKRKLFRQMAERRKNVFQQLRLLGIGVVIKFLTRRLGLADLLDVVQRALELKGRAIIVPFAEVGMDVDKPEQLAQVLAYLRNGQRAVDNG